MTTKQIKMALLAAIFAAAMMYQAFINYRRGEVGGLGLLTWEVVWGGLVVAALFPGLFQRFAAVAHVARLLDLVTIVGLLFLGSAVYYLHLFARRLEKMVVELVRAEALRDLDTDPG